MGEACRWGAWHRCREGVDGLLGLVEEGEVGADGHQGARSA